MAEAMKMKELIVAIPNKVGTLAKLLRALADAGVNVLAMSGEGRGKTGRVRFVPSDAAKASKALKKAGLPSESGAVLLVELPDSPGSGARLTEALSGAGLNIHSAYASATGGKAVVVLNVDKMAAAQRVIKSM